MNEPEIINSLLRVDGFSGSLPPGFERPHHDLAFAVHELGIHQEVAGWWTTVRTTLQTHAPFLHEVQQSAGVVTLFVEPGARHPVFRLEPPALAVLGEVGVALEIHHRGP